jgi:hypothetical protein
MTVAVHDKRRPVASKGHNQPRVAPPVPARSDLDAYKKAATVAGIDLMPWQETAARYLEALGADGRHLYREVAVIVARQNGKSQLLIPLIVKRLLAGKRIMHTAQDRTLPREIFGTTAEIMWEQFPELFPKRNGRATKPRYTNGSEEVRLTNGAIYSIVAPSRSGARGPSRDLVIIDELREMVDWDFIAAAKPTLKASKDPQIVYLSNAGTDDSVVLNALTARADTDEALAYLEWSAAPNRAVDDVIGWAEANPAMGHERGEMGDVYETLVAELRTAILDNTIGIFETENLCRSSTTTLPRVISEQAWLQCQGPVEQADKPAMAFAMDPSGRRASVVRAWLQTDGRVAVDEVIEASGELAPIDTERLGKDIVDRARKDGSRQIGFASWTDKDIARYVPRAKAVDEKEFAAASEMFARYVSAGRIVWQNGSHITADVPATIRRSHTSGAWQAVPATPERSVTAVLAAIRAVWLASAPKPPAPRIF